MSYEKTMTTHMLKVPTLKPRLAPSMINMAAKAPIPAPVASNPVPKAPMPAPGLKSHIVPPRPATLRPPVGLLNLNKPKIEEPVKEEPVAKVTEPETAVAPSVDVQTASVVEDIKQEKINDEVPVETVVVTDTEQDSAKDEEVKKPRRRSGSAKKDKAPIEAPELAEAVKTLIETNEIEMPKTECTYAAALGILFPTDISEAWDNNFYEEVESKMSEIVITDDINPAVIRVLEAKIDDLYSIVRLEHSKIKALLEDFAGKNDSQIDRVKTINAVGANVEERKRNAVLGAMEYKAGGVKLNLFEIADTLRQQYIYLQGILDQLNFKHSILITINASLRTESAL